MRSMLSFASTAALLLATAHEACAGYLENFHKRAIALEKRRPGPISRRSFQHPEIARRAEKYLNDKTKQFSVNGTGLPDVPFDIGESYAGLLPVSDDPNEDKKLFFWYFPTTNPNCTEEITIWFNGGPGCSSLSGLLTENGPFTWEAGTLAPVANPYTWVNLTNMVWIEQPVGVGFTQGKPTITNEYELSDQFNGFWKNFVDTFDMHKWKTYITGESYGGYYVPYVANGFIEANDTDYFNLGGIAINDPIIGSDTDQEQVVVKPFIDYWQRLLFLNDTFIEEFSKLNDACGYTDYYNKFFKFPPPPSSEWPSLPDPYDGDNATCATFDIALAAILEVNPCFNLYHISETCPHPYSQLGIVNTGDYQPPGAVVYFNRTDVQKAINAPVGTNWNQCNNGVFANDDTDHSVGPSRNGVLTRVIEYTNNTLIGSGNLDMLLSTNGTLLELQNMTWNGAQGFSKYPDTPLFSPYHPEYNGGALAGAGVLGSWGTERGLTFYQTQLAGHELPGYTPGAAYRAIEIMLGRVKDFSEMTGFTTQTGDFGNNVNATSSPYLSLAQSASFVPHRLGKTHPAPGGQGN